VNGGKWLFTRRPVLLQVNSTATYLGQDKREWGWKRLYSWEGLRVGKRLLGVMNEGEDKKNKTKELEI
jgi:hypothetical protein